MSAPDLTLEPPKSRRLSLWIRRVLRGVLISVAISCAVALITRWVSLHKAEIAYQGAAAEADARDPGWRWRELLARRQEVRADQNSANCMWEASEQISHGEQVSFLIPNPAVEAVFGKRPSPRDELESLAPNDSIPKHVVDTLRDALAQASDAVATARRIESLSNGRHDVPWTASPLASPSGHLSESRKIVYLLTFDALATAADGDRDRGLRSCVAALNVARSIGDEPLMTSQLGRIGSGNLALTTTERVLGQGAASDPVLRSLQSLLHTEALEPLALIALRGDRAANNEGLDLAYRGEMALQEMLNWRPRQPEGWDVVWHWWHEKQFVRANQAVLIEQLSKLVESAKGPPGELRAGLQAAEAWASDPDQEHPASVMARALIPAMTKAARAVLRYQAACLTAETAIAVERFRLAHHRWPQPLQEIVPNYLEKLPDDPFGDGPLLYRRTKEGVVIYSVGPNEKDDGGDVQARGGQPPDIGFRLYDPEHRGKPASRIEPAAEKQ